jgi:hypothetical protein
MAQNGSPISTIIEIIDSSNLSQIKQKVKMAEASMQKLQQAQQQAEQENQQMILQQEQMKMDKESQERALDRQNKIDVALIQADTQREMGQLNLAGLDDDRTIDLEREKLHTNTQLKREEIAAKTEIDRKKVENDRIKADAAMKSANRPASSGSK